MSSSHKPPMVHVLPIIIFFSILFVGCAQTEEKDEDSLNVSVAVLKKSPFEIRRDIETWMNSNPCGVVNVRRPLFNITGFLTDEVRPNAWAYLFASPNTSTNSALHVVQNCRFLTLTQIRSDGRSFAFDPIPPGNYVVMVPRKEFLAAQGFPIVNEYNLSNYSLEIAFHGGDHGYSVVAFSIHQNISDG